MKRNSPFFVRLLFSVVFLAFFSVLTNSESHASITYVQTLSDVKPIFRVEIYLNQGVHTFTTSSIATASPAPDPVMRLWSFDSNPKEELMEDDANGTLDPQFTYNIQNAGYYILVVHAWRQANHGQANVTVSGATSHQFTNISFGGADVEISSSATSTKLDVQTVFAPGPNGMTDSVMYGVGCGTQTAFHFDDDGGVGYASRFNNDHYSICRVIVGPFMNPSNPHHSPPSGDVRIIVNDWNNDNDQDGLGANLELALKTCDNATHVYTLSNGQQRSCGAVYNIQDTDRDGLLDYEETYGVDALGNPQYLPKWGANPAQKDIFIEVDYGLPIDKNFLQPGSLRLVADYFSKGKSHTLRNFTVQDGVKLHFDIGRNPTPGSPASDYTLYGDWGGSQEFTWDSTGKSEWQQLRKDTNYFSAIRHNRFRHFLRREGNGSGIAEPGRDAFYVYSWAQSPKTTAHEIGHTALLFHWGSHRWGPTVNCKPNYVSIMNYGYGLWNENTIPGSGGSGGIPGQKHPGFSQDDFAISVQLNPASLSEAAGLLSKYDSNYVPLFLGTGAYGFDFLLQTANCGVMCSIDWNRNNSFSPTNTHIRSGVTLSRHCRDNTIHNTQKLHTVNAPNTADGFKGSPVLMRNNDNFYIFYLDDGGSIHHMVAKVRMDRLYGSCNDNMDVIKTTKNEQILGTSIACLNWQSGPVFESGATSVNAISYNNKILLIYTKTDASNNRVLYARRLTGATQSDGQIPSSSWSNPSTRNLGPHSYPPPSSTANSTTPSFSYLNLPSAPSSFHGESSIIGLFYVDRSTDPGTHKWYWFNRTSEVLSSTPNTVKNTNGNDLKGYYPPAFTMWPGRIVETVEDKTCGVATDADNALDFYCFDATSVKWEKLTNIAFASRPTKLTSQPDIIFHRPRKTDGSFASNDNSEGEFWLSYRTNAGGLISERHYYYRSQIVSNSKYPFASHFTTTNQIFTSNSWGTSLFTKNGRKLSLYEDSIISGVKAVSIQRVDDDDSDVITFMPFFDDTFRTLPGNHLSTGNDFRIMERGICWGLHSTDYGWFASYSPGKANTFCGDSSIPNSYWGY